jgi:hypothetical protein
MTTEHLACLDAIATAAAGKPCRVYLDDAFPLHLRGVADYDPRSRHYEIRLNPVLLTWMRAELESTFYHEVGHVKCGHVQTDLPPKERAAFYHRVLGPKPQTHNEVYGTIGAQVKEIAADQEAARIRGSWPYAAYSLFALLQGKETYP